MSRDPLYEVGSVAWFGFNKFEKIREDLKTTNAVLLTELNKCPPYSVSNNLFDFWISRKHLQEFKLTKEISGRDVNNPYLFVTNDITNKWDDKGLEIPFAFKIFIPMQGAWAAFFTIRSYSFYVTRFKEICDALCPGQEYVENLIGVVDMIIWKDEDCICWPDFSISPDYFEPGIYEIPTSSNPPSTIL
jgi:hypothetical protein